MNPQEIFDEYGLGALGIEDIQNVETYNRSFAKLVNAYRISLLIQKATDVGHETELISKINLCTEMMKEVLFGLEDKRKQWYAAKEKEESKKKKKK